MTDGTHGFSDDVGEIANDADASMDSPGTETMEDYAVGYCKPPKATQWKKGQSGNPTGKKRGTKSLKELFLYVANKKVTIKDAAGVKKVSQLEAAFSLLFHHANKGNPRCIALVLELAEQFLPKPPPETAEDAVKRLNDAADACPGYFVMTPNHTAAIEGMRKLYGPKR